MINIRQLLRGFEKSSGTIPVLHMDDQKCRKIIGMK